MKKITTYISKSHLPQGEFPYFYKDTANNCWRLNNGLGTFNDTKLKNKLIICVALLQEDGFKGVIWRKLKPTSDNSHNYDFTFNLLSIEAQIIAHAIHNYLTKGKKIKPHKVVNDVWDYV